MIINFQELDKRLEKVLNVIVSLGFSYKMFSNQKINIIDNNVSFAEKRNIGVVTLLNSGKLTVRVYGYRKRVTLKYRMKSNEIVFTPNAKLSEVGSRTRELLKKYVTVNKTL